jgi:hypothetical protein
MVKKLRDEFLGLDTETIEGFAKLICTSEGKVFIIKSLDNIYDFFKRFKKLYFFAFNADYDVQAILKYFPFVVINKLVKGIPLKYRGMSFQYIKDKYFRFNDNYIFDCYQYYQCGLALAARLYLKEEKGDIDRSKITLKNVFSSGMIRYCIQDAKLALKLFLYFYNGLPENLKDVKPISSAFYSFMYFRDELKANKVSSKVNDVFRQAYSGGRFEVFERGYFKGVYVYDINSAYPFEISKLHGLKNCSIVRLGEYVKSASYSIYHIKVNINNKFFSPLLYRLKGLCVFPVGDFKGFVTKGEYESIVNYKPEIISAIHVFGDDRFPFRDKIEKLYAWKNKSSNPLPYKILLNSLYGKTGQKIRKYVRFCAGEPLSIFKDENGVLFFEFEDISGSNFVYASEITSKVRLRMYDVLKNNYDKVIAIQTDSLFSKKRLELKLSNKLGDWKEEFWDELYILGSGVYFYRKNNGWFGKFRGYNFSGKKTLEILNQVLNSKKSITEFKTLKHFSILEANRLHDESLMNLILEVSRKLNINFDRKRVWMNSWHSGKELKEKRIESMAIYLYKNAGQLELY